MGRGLDIVYQEGYLNVKLVPNNESDPEVVATPNN
jgi:hypothetical protein